MLKGIYSAAAGMTSEMIANDLIAENLANISTVGFKAETASFRTFGETLIDKIQKSGVTPLGVVSQGSQVFQTNTIFRQGSMMQTGNPLDLAINGEGFFVVKDGDGSTYYTRAGNFTQDAEGYLVTMDGDKVQGEGGDVLIAKETRQIQISKTGEIFGDGVTIGRLNIAQFDDEDQLERLGANAYTSDVPPQKGLNTTIEQGVLEQSNSNVVSELVNSITALRAYETMQKTIQMQNQTLEKTINEVGRTG